MTRSLYIHSALTNESPLRTRERAPPGDAGGWGGGRGGGGTVCADHGHVGWSPEGCWFDSRGSLVKEMTMSQWDFTWLNE